MNTARLKFFLFVIWGMIAAIGAGLALWALTHPTASFGEITGANPPATASLPPKLTSISTRMPPTARPTLGVIIPTRRPVSPTPITPTTTPVTPLPTLWIPSNPSTYLPGMDPLTGLMVDDPKILERRPVVVKITTFPRSVRAYQSGLARADVVYEYYIEDGLTRFIAVFYGKNAEKAGPVRSGRYFDEHIMRMYRGPLVFANADDRVEEYLLNSDIKFLLFLPRPDNCPPLCRDKTIEGYNNFFVDTAGVGKFLADNSKQPLRLTTFSNIYTAFQGVEIKQIYTRYSTYSYNYWDYDPTRKIYLRYSDEADAPDSQGQVYAAHIDHLTDQQVTADNVVILAVAHNFKNEFDRADQVFDINLIGSGPAYIFRAGRMIKAKWIRDRLDQPIQLLDEANHPTPLKPGVTFYQVINPQSIFLQDSTTMRFEFSIPPRDVALPTPIHK